MRDYEDMERLSRILETQRLDAGIRQTHVARVFGLRQQSISLYEKEPERLLARGAEFVTQFLRQYKFSEERIGRLLREHYPAATAALLASAEAVPVDGFTQISIYAAGTGPAWGDDEILEQIKIPGLDGEDYIGLRATGESMTPYLNRGDIAIVKCDDGIVAPGDYVAVWFSDDGCVVKRFVAEVSDTLMLESLNPGPTEDRVFTAPPGSRVLGKVVRRLLDG